MKINRSIRLSLMLLVLVLTVGCDQVSKGIVRKHVDAHQNIKVIGSHFTIMKVENSGAFLSLGDSLSPTAKNIILSILPLLALVLGFIFVLMKTQLSGLMLFASCSIIGGGLGNVYDRIIHGSVTDFLFMDFGIFRTGVFNLADVSVMSGISILLIHSFFKKKN